MQPSIGTERCWQVVCVPKAYPVEIGLARQQSLADELTSQTARPTLMVWRCLPALLVTRSDKRLPHFDEAAAKMESIGWPVLLRKSGGGACPVASGTVQMSTIEAVSSDIWMNAKYAVLTRLIQSTLGFFQIVSQTGFVAGAYCPGSYDLAVQGKKIAGMSQHWFRNRCGIRCVITVASINIEEPPDVLAGTVNQFYDCAGSPLRCQAASLTNMRLCNGNSHLVGGHLVSTVVNQLKASVDLLGGAARQDAWRVPYVP